LFGPEVIADPYPAYHKLRALDPVHWEEGMQLWLVTRYDDVVAGLRDLRLSADRRSVYKEWLPTSARMDLLYRMLENQMLFKEPPDHTRLRGLFNRAFTPRVVERLRPRVQEVVDGLLDAAEPRGRMDVIGDLAYPLPAVVIAAMLGVPAEDRDRFKRWSDDFAYFLGLHSRPSAEVAERTWQSLAAADDYFRDVVARRRSEPGDDLLSGLVAARDRDDRLSEEELLANVVLLLAAAHETTTNLIGNGLLALLRNPDQLRKLQNEPGLIETAVEEFLRYDSPVQLLIRTCVEDVEMGGKRIRAGQGVLLMLAAANRDPAQFAEPDRLDVARRDNRHVSFGQGHHFCFGAPLARLEGAVAIATVLRRLPGLRLEAENLEWHESFAFRGVKSLPVAF
jgi:cytochrome P450